MALTGFKVLTSSGFDKEIIMVDFLGKTMFDNAHLQVLMKDGLLGKKLKYFKGQLKELRLFTKSNHQVIRGSELRMLP